LESLTSEKDFWQSSDARDKLRELSLIKKEVGKFRDIEKLKDDISTMLELTEESNNIEDGEIIPILYNGEKLINEWEIEQFLSGPYDALNAFISFSSGAGGTDAQDWTQMLLKMYLRWAEKKGFKVEILEEMPGDEAGIKSALVYVKGDFAYGLLRGESGVHRLVRISPFDANKRRHTSFTLVEITPEIGDVGDIEIDEKDLRIDIYRSSGHGGQNVQKVETAIRITHIPTGITAECQNERSQLQNKIMAMKVLKSRLLILERKKREKKLKEIKGSYKSAEWGNEIRSYVLQPYKMVKDHRTGVETGKVNNVLEGDIDAFIWAYLKAKKENL
jgi:peptide chain release factor 2